MSINTENVKKSLDEDFIKRFVLTPNELVNASIYKRKDTLENYVRRRIEKKFEGEEYTYDNLFFSIQRIRNIIGKIILLMKN
ncbi:hypothetical protein [Parvimonas micra]